MAGYGHLRRKFGLSIDNLLFVQIVTADGQVRAASATENPDLFWAVRGAGSSFGVVTSFEFRADSVGPIVQLSAPFFPLEGDGTVLGGVARVHRGSPRRDQLRCRSLERSRRGRISRGTSAPTCGDSRGGVRGPARRRRPNHAAVPRARPPLLDMTGPIPFTALQAAFDPLLDAFKSSSAFPRRLSLWSSVTSMPIYVLQLVMCGRIRGNRFPLTKPRSIVRVDVRRERDVRQHAATASRPRVARTGPVAA